MNEVLMYTDGSLRPGGIGGWSCLLILPNHRWVLYCDRVKDTTINRMELMAMYRGLSALDQPAKVLIISDSQYAVNCINSWIELWRKKNWVNSQGKPVSNLDLLQKLDQLIQRHQVKARWIKAHTNRQGIDYLGNDCVDWFAQHKTAKLTHR